MSQTRYETCSNEVEIECCDHCHGDPADCRNGQSDRGANASDLLDLLVAFLDGRVERSDLVRTALRYRPLEALVA